MFVNEESAVLNAVIVKGRFNTGEGENLQSFNALFFNEFLGIRTFEGEFGDMVCIKVNYHDADEVKEAVIWTGERDFIDFARRIITREEWNGGGAVPAFKLRPYYTEGENRGLALYEAEGQTFKKVEVMPRDKMTEAGISEWVKPTGKKKYWDSTAQFADLVERVKAILGEY